MTQRELIYIKTVADEKSISRAAKKLFIAQPSLSQYIKRIEAGLGTPLFRRTSAGLTLTYAGERYYLMAVQILKLCDNFEMEISDINNMKTGRIHIGITNFLGTVLLPKVLPRFTSLCPSVELNVTEETSAGLESLLAAGKLDFVIMHAPQELENPLLQYEQLSRDPFLAVTSRDRPLSLCSQENKSGRYPLLERECLIRSRFIMVPQNQRIRQITDSILRAAGIKSPEILLTVKSFATAQLLAAAGLGVALIPSQYAKITVSDVEPVFYSIPEAYCAYWDLCITTAKDAFLSKADQLFLRILREHLK